MIVNLTSAKRYSIKNLDVNGLNIKAPIKIPKHVFYGNAKN